MYNLLLRESFEVRSVHRRQEDRGSSLQHRRPKDSSPAESIARARYTLSSRTIFHGSFASFTPFIATSPFCIAAPVGMLPTRFVVGRRRLFIYGRSEIVPAHLIIIHICIISIDAVFNANKLSNESDHPAESSCRYFKYRRHDKIT